MQSNKTMQQCYEEAELRRRWAAIISAILNDPGQQQTGKEDNKALLNAENERRMT
jgi:hypothetical protein